MACKWFLIDEQSAAANQILRRVSEGEDAIVPALFRWEIANIFMVAERAGRIAATDVDYALDLLRDLPIFVDRPGDRIFRGSEIDLAREYEITPYDAAYLAVASSLAAELVTSDDDMARAARDLGLDVTLI